MDHHNYSFFGQKTGILLDSAGINQPYLFLCFLKKKQDNSWEKPSLKEGKNIKINLLEMISILRIFRNPNSKWSTVHKFGDETTSITVENKNNIISFMISGYGKQIKFPESELFIDLLDHIYHEKIIYATGSNGKKGKAEKKEYIQINQADNRQNEISKLRNAPLPEEYPEEMDQMDQMDQLEQPKQTKQTKQTKSPKTNNIIDPEAWYNSLEVQDDYRLVLGTVNEERAKAISFNIVDLKNIWIPTSCIDQNHENQTNKGIWIKEWFLVKKMEDIFAES